MDLLKDIKLNYKIKNITTLDKKIETNKYKTQTIYNYSFKVP